LQALVHVFNKEVLKKTLDTESDAESEEDEILSSDDNIVSDAEIVASVPSHVNDDEDIARLVREDLYQKHEDAINAGLMINKMAPLIGKTHPVTNPEKDGVMPLLQEGDIKGWTVKAGPTIKDHVTSMLDYAKSLIRKS
jgi:hypothetical protein